ncbi:uncharacterized protein LOC127250680 isoform X2 [Andrographis paniculata]|uniref:uncharacterized protein LOC127250680 isoform X2 n=1 Tax=Andrographis paniculata TaxID=175694 RepID=UPI0021E78AF8|nr:uncharacterized protein LOC127250680 isoform X2 [Andrographis paniculata]
METASTGYLLRCSAPHSASLLSFNPLKVKTHFSFLSNSPKTTPVTPFSNRPPLLRFPCPRARSSPLTISSSSSSSSTSGGGHVAADIPNHDSETLSETSNSEDTPALPKVDKSGRFCSPRAARELALTVLYAACLDGSDPLRLFERRLNARIDNEYEFNKAALLEYSHMSFGGPPVSTETMEEANEILRNDERESNIEAEVLSAPLKLVYSKLILRFTRKLLVAVTQNWDSNVTAIDIVAPLSWKREPASRILEFSILHLAISEIMILGTRHQIVINELGC